MSNIFYILGIAMFLEILILFLLFTYKKKDHDRIDEPDKTILGKRKKILSLILLTIFIDMIGFGILIPIIPLLLTDPGSEFYLLPSNMPPQTGFILLGLLITVYPLMQFFSTPILGQLSDKYGRRKILAISIAGTSLGYLIFAIGILTRNIPLLFFARALDGITGGNLAVAQAAIADITPPKDRAKNFGLIGAVFGLGFIFGPFIGGRLSDPTFISWFNASTPFFFAAILSMLNVISLLIIFPETLKIFKKEKVRFNQSIKNVIRAYSKKEMRGLYLTQFLFAAGFTFYTTFFGVFLIHRFGFDQTNIGDYFAYVGLWILFTQGFLIRKISHKFEDYKVLRISYFIGGLAILFYLLPGSFWMILFIAPIFAISNGLSMSFATGLISKSAGPHEQGEVLGISTSVQALAQFLVPITAGLIAASLAPTAPLFIASLVIISAGISFWLFYKIPKKEIEKEIIVDEQLEVK